jgi:hypothetical protein
MRDAKDVSGAEIADLYLASRADALPFLRRVHPTMKCGVGFKTCYCAEARPGLLGWTDMWWDS